MYATKHSLKMLSFLTNLRCLKLYCRGRMPFNNPWKLGFSLDRREQCVDCLFSSGSLEYLEDLDLSAFCQTVDSNLVQLICSAHLSMRSNTKHHLKRVNLSNCYHVGDAGIKWLVGSPVSNGIDELDLSGTYMTGSCFFRQMTRYLFFKWKMDIYNQVWSPNFGPYRTCSAFRIWGHGKEAQRPTSPCIMFWNMWWIKFEEAFTCLFNGDLKIVGIIITL